LLLPSLALSRGLRATGPNPTLPLTAPPPPHPTPSQVSKGIGGSADVGTIATVVGGLLGVALLAYLALTI
jgi:hypothetical protein